MIRKGLKRLSKGQEPKLRGGLLRGVSILLTWAVVAYLLYLLMSVLIPQLIDSVAMLINNAESYYNKIYVWVTNLLEKNPEIAGWMEKNLESYYNDLMKVLTEQVLPGAQQMLTTITGGIWTGIWGLVTFTTNFLVGIIISVYLLAMKEKSLARCCKLLYALLQEEQARWMVRATRKTNQIFSGFVRGKMLDSLIIGILCFIGCSIFSLPYTPLVSVVVGVTNMIPFFGPFLGASAQCLPDPAGEPQAVPDLHRVHHRSAADRRQHHRPQDPGRCHRHLQLLGGGGHHRGRRLCRGAGNVLGVPISPAADAGKVHHRPGSWKSVICRWRPANTSTGIRSPCRRRSLPLRQRRPTDSAAPAPPSIRGCRCFFAGCPGFCRGSVSAFPAFFCKN